MIVRCSPAFVAALTGSAPRTAPAPSGERGVLVVCGSFVPATTAQLECARATASRGSVPARRVPPWPATAPDAEVRADLPTRPASASATAGLAVVATERERDPGLVDAASQQRIAARAGARRAARRRGRRDRQGRDHLGRDRPRRPGRRVGARDRADRPRRRALAAVRRARTTRSSPATSAAPSLLADVVAAMAPARDADAVRRPARGAPRGHRGGRVHLLRPRDGRGRPAARRPRPARA